MPTRASGGHVSVGGEGVGEDVVESSVDQDCSETAGEATARRHESGQFVVHVVRDPTHVEFSRQLKTVVGATDVDVRGWLFVVNTRLRNIKYNKLYFT